VSRHWISRNTFFSTASFNVSWNCSACRSRSPGTRGTPLPAVAVARVRRVRWIVGCAVGSSGRRTNPPAASDHTNPSGSTSSSNAVRTGSGAASG
jgi:hypothetical protein